jgi:protein required for attachment to host cells
MRRLCIALVDATRARIFTFEELGAPAGERTQELEERITLVHPARRRRPSEIFTDSRPGSDRAPSGRGFAHSDHREAALREMDRQFADEVAGQIELVVDAFGSSNLILAASPRMLGFLRAATRPLVESGVALGDLDRDLVRLTPAALHDFLAGRGLLPARERLLAEPDQAGSGARSGGTKTERASSENRRSRL